MRRALVIFAGVAVLALGASACGGGGGGRYEETGLDITFKIPGGFHVAHDVSVSKSSGASAIDQAAIGPTGDCPKGTPPSRTVCVDPDNLIIIQRYNLRATITASNVAKFKGEVDRVIGTLAGKKVSGREAEYGGLPGYEYVIDVSQPAQGQSRLAVLFDANVEYLVNCQSTPSLRDKIEKGCRKVLDSIEPA